jgi:hypothetical protein
MTGNQEQIAASHEIDGVRKEKERLTAASLNNRRALAAAIIFSFLFLWKCPTVGKEIDSL